MIQERNFYAPIMYVQIVRQKCAKSGSTAEQKNKIKRMNSVAFTRDVGKGGANKSRKSYIIVNRGCAHCVRECVLRVHKREPRTRCVSSLHARRKFIVSFQ